MVLFYLNHYNIMAKKKLITLAKELDFNFEYEYFNYMVDTYINGQFSSCRTLFSEMKKEDQKSFIYQINDLEAREFYFKLL